MNTHTNAQPMRPHELHEFVEYGPVVSTRFEVEDGTHYQIDFRSGLGAVAVGYLLHDPLRSLNPDARLDDVARGLRMLTYPNSRISRSIDSSRVPGVSTSHRRDVQNDTRALATHLDNFQEQPALSHIRGPYLTERTARQAIAADLKKVKPLDFKTVAAAADIEVDDLAVRRMKQARSAIRRVVIDDYLTALPFDDRKRLLDYLYERDYLPLEARDDEGYRHNVSMPRDILPARFTPELFIAAYIRMLSGHPLRDDAVPAMHMQLQYWLPRQVSTAYARLGWTRKHDGTRTLTVSGTEQKWSPVRNRYDLVSPLLGATLLANAADIDYQKPAQRILRRRGWQRRQPYPRYVSGVLPALLRYREEQLLDHAYIKDAENIIDEQQSR